MTGQVVQVNISPGGVPKRPIPRGTITPLGLVGDACIHTKYHGGPQQALLLIAEEILQDLAAKGFAVYNGAVGENITMRGLDPRQMRLGQQFRVGSALVEITKVRMPCRTIEVYGAGIGGEIYDRRVKAGDTTSPRWGLSGFYVRVIEEGEVGPGDTIRLASQVV